VLIPRKWKQLWAFQIQRDIIEKSSMMAHGRWENPPNRAVSMRPYNDPEE
jgi:hypothetical protein